MSAIVSNRPARSTSTLAATELFAVLLVAPALLFPSPKRLVVAVIVPIVWACQCRVNGRFVPATPLNAALFLLLGMVAVSLLATYDVGASLGKVSGVLLGAMVFWTSTRWVTTPERLRTATLIFLLAGGGLAIIGLLGTNWLGKFRILATIIERLPKAIRGVPGAEEGFQPNAVAGCLVLFIPLQVTLLTAEAGGWLLGSQSSASRRAALVAVHVLLIALTTGTLILTQSRGAWIGLVTASLTFFGWHSRLTRAIAVATVAIVGTLAYTMGPSRLAALAISQSGPGMEGNVSGRMELWSRAVYGIQDFPFTGMGMNAFRKVMPVLYPTFLTAPDLDVAHAHNHLLQTALDLGIPGLIAYVAIWLTVAALLVRVYRLSAEPAARALAGGLGAGLIAHFAFSMTDAIPLGAKVGILFWLTLALAVAVHQVSLPSDGSTARIPPEAHRS